MKMNDKVVTEVLSEGGVRAVKTLGRCKEARRTNFMAVLLVSDIMAYTEVRPCRCLWHHVLVCCTMQMSTW